MRATTWIVAAFATASLAGCAGAGNDGAAGGASDAATARPAGSPTVSLTIPGVAPFTPVALVW